MKMNELDMIRALLDEPPPSAEVMGEGRRRIPAGDPPAERGRRLAAGTGPPPRPPPAAAPGSAWVSADGKRPSLSGQAMLGLTAVPVKKVHGTWTMYYFGLLPVKYQDLGSLPRDPGGLDRHLGHLLPARVGPAGDREF